MFSHRSRFAVEAAPLFSQMYLLLMSLEMHFLPENQRDQQHKERAYGKVLSPGGMQIGFCLAFFVIYDSSHGNKLD